MFKPIRTVVETIVKLALFAYRRVHSVLVLSFLSGPLLKYVKFWSSFVVVVDDKRMSNTGWESLVELVANVAWVPVVYVYLIVYLDQFRFPGNCPPTPPLSQY